ncbi:MAG: GIY-YIG nuclease family protein [Alphaproteobacteria bacterium]|nr:GIY-YIG nuclease family protein [Alphaproteobacteria bacterium]
MTTSFDLPNGPGAYALLIRLPRRLKLSVERLRHPVLDPGCYVYCGSARGPGGLAARVGRHLRRDKALRWHVDYLTASGRIIDVICRPDGSECALVRHYGQLPGVSTPVPGFGSSDCRQCKSHLLLVPAKFDLSV